MKRLRPPSDVARRGAAPGCAMPAPAAPTVAAVVGALLLVGALTSCEKAAPPAKVDPYLRDVPAHGALVKMCGLTGTGPSCVFVIFDADARQVRFHPWGSMDDHLTGTKALSPARSAELFGFARRVLDTGTPVAEDVTDFSLHLSISDGARTAFFEPRGPFTDEAASALVEGLITETR